MIGAAVQPQRAAGLVVHAGGTVEFALQQLGQGGDAVTVADHHRQLEVQPEAAVVEVGAADDADIVVGDEGLGVQHARAVLVDLHAGMQQLVEVGARGLGDEPGVTHLRHQQAYVQAAQRRRGQRHPRGLAGHERPHAGGGSFPIPSRARTPAPGR
ncbi:hypothetical protein G6F35_016878 [Rhizopus arrhizus]|nr:hypothetical protein G6F35_016878 [Rhizopus arrhizus]